MRYFHFTYYLYVGNIHYKGVLNIKFESFPSQKALRTILCDGRIPGLLGHEEDESLVFLSIFEFKNKEDFDNWTKDSPYYEK